MKEAYRAYMIEQLKNLLAIDSTTGQFAPMEAYLMEEASRLGYAPTQLEKGGVTVPLGGSGNGLVITAHVDDIGLMVRYVNPDGTIRVCNVGGLYPFQCDLTNVRVHSRAGQVYTGTMRRKKSSLHLMNEEERAERCDYEKNLFLFLDEEIHSAQDVEALGIRAGDLIALDPMTVFTSNGYIKSRFLDDKASAAILLAYMKYVKAEGVSLPRQVTAYFSLYEEVGHGGASGIPEDTTEVLAVDIGCCGPDTYSHEKKVTICPMDAFSPYHKGTVDALVTAAERANVPYALDLCVPRYGSDADAALKSGRDVRHGLIGPGVLGTHGYERTHVESLEATLALLKAYAG